MKRTLLAALFVLPCVALPALADDAKPKSDHTRVTWEQHFANANATHDGHLTSEQAKVGYPSLFKHFAEIDAGNKGYVTKEQVKAWHQLQRAQRQPEPENKLRPQHSFQPTTGAHPAVKASSQGVVPQATTPRGTVPRGTVTVGPDAPPAAGTPG